MENTSDHLISDDEIPLPAEIDELENIANKKIQKEKNVVVKKETKIREEQMKLDFISKPRQANPLVNVNINMGGLYNDKNLNDQTSLNNNKTNTVEPIKGGKHKTQKNTSRRK